MIDGLLVVLIVVEPPSTSKWFTIERDCQPRVGDSGGALDNADICGQVIV